MFIPDIDKWQKWDRDIRQMVKSHDDLFIDGTFYKNGEIPGRNMSEIPHPFIEETMALLETLPPSEKSKVWFIHMNHTNPALLHLHKIGPAISQQFHDINKRLEYLRSLVKQ